MQKEQETDYFFFGGEESQFTKSKDRFWGRRNLFLEYRLH